MVFSKNGSIGIRPEIRHPPDSKLEADTAEFVVLPGKFDAAYNVMRGCMTAGDLVKNGNDKLLEPCQCPV